jgi:hypothetical protein
MVLLKTKFKQTILQCISHIIGQSLFQWCDTKRSWDLFISYKEVERTKSHSKGIFLLPDEDNRKPWTYISTLGKPGDTSRTCGRVPLQYSDYMRLLENKWLSGDIISAYISLMGHQVGTTVLQTYFWQAMSQNKMIKSFVESNLFVCSDG